jgi:cytoskeletal protein CcmA (bactofilin family)
MKPSQGKVPSSYYGSQDVLDKMISKGWKIPSSSMNLSQPITHPHITESLSEDNNDKSIQDFQKSEDVFPKDLPNSIIGEGVIVTGNFQYNGLFQLDGKLEGSLISQNGNLIVGKSGYYIGNINDFGTILVDGGTIRGNIDSETILLCSDSTIIGDIKSKSLTIRGNNKIVINGFMNICPE